MTSRYATILLGQVRKLTTGASGAGGKELRRLAGHRGAAHALAFWPDGKRLASGSDDTTVLVWDVGGARPE